jgi:hypothetical protein
MQEIFNGEKMRAIHATVALILAVSLNIIAWLLAETA